MLKVKMTYVTSNSGHSLGVNAHPTLTRKLGVSIRISSESNQPRPLSTHPNSGGPASDTENSVRHPALLPRKSSSRTTWKCAPSTDNKWPSHHSTQHRRHPKSTSDVCGKSISPFRRAATWSRSRAFGRQPIGKRGSSAENRLGMCA